MIAVFASVTLQLRFNSCIVREQLKRRPLSRFNYVNALVL
ncbi:MAG: hypothetical protein OFPII_10500 [Osedax symbiont Rs1]|nr:MAG: hypothetical protein OFPII_10500 [Osedax symbiont Rs1]